jgi:hypothetical protein
VLLSNISYIVKDISYFSLYKDKDKYKTINKCIITATAPATLAVATLATLTPNYEVLTN